MSPGTISESVGEGTVQDYDIPDKQTPAKQTVQKFQSRLV